MDTTSTLTGTEAEGMTAAYAALSPVEALERGFVLAPGETGILSLAAGWENPAVFEGEQNRQGFLVGLLGLMIPFDEGSELTEMPPLHHLPNTPSWFLGMVNLHGRLLPVFDLLRFLNLERESDTKQMLLVVGHDADAAGFVIDGLPQRLRWTSAMQSDADLAPRRLEAHVRASCLIDGKIWFDINTITLLNAIEESLGQA